MEHQVERRHNSHDHSLDRGCGSYFLKNKAQGLKFEFPEPHKKCMQVMGTCSHRDGPVESRDGQNNREFTGWPTGP